MPKRRVTEEQALERAIRGQIAEKSQTLYGQDITGKTFGRMFGVKDRTAQNRLNKLKDIKMGEFLHYVATAHPTDEEILAWVGR